MALSGGCFENGGRYLLNMVQLCATCVSAKQKGRVCETVGPFHCLKHFGPFLAHLCQKSG